ncbi:chorismate synthase [Endomicrobiia bacterium]|nr:chorismate synthase [Endomicrobiia bacterium]GHT46629.1 chorismate synthase [Endomicrobiia bacterium]
MIRFTTAGESHGESLLVILEGIPAGLAVNYKDIDLDLARRQKGYGRGKRMSIETDVVKILSGMRHLRTLGSPIAMSIANRDFQNWVNTMSPTSSECDDKPLLRPRPGHADLSGLIKYNVKDFRDILERASARETAARVAAGAVCKILLKEFDISIMSYTSQIGDVVADISSIKEGKLLYDTEMSEVRCPDTVASKKMIELVDKARLQGDTLGGKVVVVVKDVPAGLGSHTQWDLKLDGRLAQSLISIQAVKAVEFGDGTKLAENFGSVSHDEIFYSNAKWFYRKTNRAGGIEGGMSNGEPIVVTCTMKAIPSLANPLHSVNLVTKRTAKAEAVRSDICAVPAVGVVAEAAVAIELAKALKEKFGGDSLEDMKKNVNTYKERLKAL